MADMPTTRGRSTRLEGRTWCFAVVAATVLVGWGMSLRADDPRSPETPDLEQLRATVYELSSAPYEGRGTALGKRKTRAYLIERFRTLGLKPLFGDAAYEQEIPGPRDWDAPPDSPRPLYGHNVGAWLPVAELDGKKRLEKEPPDEVVIVSAHFDHLGIIGGRLHPGADDNASGVAMLLETARLLAARRPVIGNGPRVAGIAFVAFDLEEYALWGSRWFAAHPPWPLERVRLFMTADMVGRSLGDLPLATIFVLGTEHGTGLPERIRASARLASTGDRPLEVALLGTDIAGTRGDYGPFRDAEVPFLFFSSGEHPDYHTPRDTAERVDFDKVAAVTRVFADVAWQVALDDKRPVWREAEPLGHDEARTIRRIAVLLLERDDVAKREGRSGLGDARRTVVTGVRNECDRLLTLPKIGPDDRVWLARGAKLLLAMVF